MRLQAKKPYNFVRNPKKGPLSKKEQPKTADNKTAEIQTDQMYVAFGPLISSFSVERDFLKAGKCPGPYVVIDLLGVAFNISVPEVAKVK